MQPPVCDISNCFLKGPPSFLHLALQPMRRSRPLLTSWTSTNTLTVWMRRRQAGEDGLQAARGDGGCVGGPALALPPRPPNPPLPACTHAAASIMQTPTWVGTRTAAAMAAGTSPLTSRPTWRWWIGQPCSLWAAALHWRPCCLRRWHPWPCARCEAVHGVRTCLRQCCVAAGHRPAPAACPFTDPGRRRFPGTSPPPLCLCARCPVQQGDAKPAKPVKRAAPATPAAKAQPEAGEEDAAAVRTTGRATRSAVKRAA